jgi:hypothetical protein
VRLGGRIAASASYAADPLPSLARLRCSPLVNWWMYGKGSAAALARCAQLLCRVLIKIGSLQLEWRRSMVEQGPGLGRDLAGAGQ